jgi:hypothetical protein
MRMPLRVRELVRIVPWVLVLLSAAVGLRAQEPPEPVRTLCDKADPKNRCMPPGPECVCLPDTLEIVFNGQDDSVLFLDFTRVRPITATVIMDVKSPDTPGADIQGWSYGVLHDVSVLTLLNATTDGTDVGGIMCCGAFALCLGDPTDVVTCETNEARCPNPQPGGGFLSAVVLSLRKPVEMPAGKRSSIVQAHYETTGKAVVETQLRFTDRMAARGSPPAAINITVAGRSRLPEEVIEGLLISEFNPARFRRGDADGNHKLDLLDAVLLIRIRAGSTPGRIACDDAEDANDDGLLTLSDGIFVLNYLFLGGPALAGAECGEDGTADGLGCGVGEC